MLRSWLEAANLTVPRGRQSTVTDLFVVDGVPHYSPYDCQCVYRIYRSNNLCRQRFRLSRRIPFSLLSVNVETTVLALSSIELTLSLNVLRLPLVLF